MLTATAALVLLTADPTGDAAARVKEVIGHRGACATHPENTLAGVRAAIACKAHAAEIDARTTKDGALVCLHDADLARTTNGSGKVGELTLAEVRKLDAGSKFGAAFKGEPVPALRDILTLAKGKCAVMIDLKEDGPEYLKRVAAEVTEFGEPERMILGVRSVEQAKALRKALPKARQIGLIPTTDDIEPFAKAGVDVIRLWPKWLADESLVPRVRKAGVELHLGTGGGTRAEVVPLLAHRPESLSSDDPAQLLKTLGELRGAKE